MVVDPPSLKLNHLEVVNEDRVRGMAEEQRRHNSLVWLEMQMLTTITIDRWRRERNAMKTQELLRSPN